MHTTFFDKRNLQVTLSVLLALLMLAGAVRFLRSEGIDFEAVGHALAQADLRWIGVGVFLSLLYIVVHGPMYQEGFRAIGREVPLWPVLVLYLKRCAAGVVLPAGSLTSQVLFSRTLTDGYKVNDSEVAAASGIYAIAGVTASVMAVVPAFGWLLSQGVLPPGSVKAFALLMAFLLLLVWLGISLVRGGRVAMFVNRRMPRVAKFLKGPDWSKFDKKHIFRAVFWALVVEVAGVAHLWVAGKALGFGMTIATAVAGYVAVLLVLMTSPFLRGVGAAEALLAFVLMRYSSDAVTAASVATLFRVFEFWGVLLVALPLLFVRSRRRSQSYNGAVTAVS